MGDDLGWLKGYGLFVNNIPIRIYSSDHADHSVTLFICLIIDVFILLDEVTRKNKELNGVK